MGEATLSGNNGDSFQWEDNGLVEQFALNGSKVTISGKSIGLAGGFKAQVSRDTTIFAKLGMHKWDADVTASAPGINVSESDDGTDKFYGFGIDYALTSAVSVRGEFERFEFEDEDVDNIGVSLIAHF